MNLAFILLHPLTHGGSSEDMEVVIVGFAPVYPKTFPNLLH